MMELAHKKNVKVISLAIAAIMVVGIFVLAVQGKNMGGGDATSNSAIGKINYNQVMAAAPGWQKPRPSCSRPPKTAARNLKKKART